MLEVHGASFVVWDACMPACMHPCMPGAPSITALGFCLLGQSQWSVVGVQLCSIGTAPIAASFQAAHFYPVSCINALVMPPITAHANDCSLCY